MCNHFFQRINLYECPNIKFLSFLLDASEEKQSSSQQLMGAVLSTSSQDPKRFKVEGI